MWINADRMLCLRGWVHLVSLIFVCNGKIPLGGEDWKLTSSGRSGGGGQISVNATVPGNVYTSLVEAGIVPDPYVGENDVNLRWIADSNWTYETTFDMPYSMPYLFVVVLKGVDTVCSVSVNGQTVGTTSNMFREYYFILPSSLIRVGKNSLRAVFTSPIAYAKTKFELYQQSIGKMQSSFSWDWGPAFPGMGFYREVYLEITDSCFLDSVSAAPVKQSDSDSWTVNVDLFLWCSKPDLTARASIDLSELNLTKIWTVKSGNLKVGMNRLYQTVVVPKSAVEMWWPRGYGVQKLYVIVGSVKMDTSHFDKMRKSVKIGFRTVELVQDPVIVRENVSHGLTFYFKVNDLPMFLKGTNWIPADSFQTRITRDKLRFLFRSMVESNMNALRVWGGGVYESDYFYQLADEYGLLIWQDMMFAVALYPANQEFLRDVAAEVSDQLRRLKHHPSILVWAGNNENELGLRGGWYHAPHMATLEQYESDYIKLYNATVWEVVNVTDFNSRPFLLSSPSNGIQTIREGGVALHPGDWKYGDMHVYDYLSNAWMDSTFPTGRCVTEYGYQSFPSFLTLKSAIPNSSDWSYFGQKVMHRQHHPFGNIQMLSQVLMHFKIPGCSWSHNDTEPLTSAFAYNGVHTFAQLCETPLEKDGVRAEARFLEDMIYLSQVHQAKAYQTETEHYRRWRNRTDSKTGHGQTMCALYWQLNDIWQAPTWATIDWGLKWKMAHYFARKFFSPVIVSPFLELNRLKVSTMSDLAHDVFNATLKIELLAWSSGLKPIYTLRKRVPKLPALTSFTVFDEPQSGLRSLVASGMGVESSFVAAEDFLVKGIILKSRDAN